MVEEIYKLLEKGEVGLGVLLGDGRSLSTIPKTCTVRKVMDLYLVEPIDSGVAEEYAFIDTFIGNMLSIEFNGKEYITNELYYMLEKGKTVKIKVKENVECCPLILKEQEKSGYVLLKKWCGSYLIMSKDSNNIMMVDTRSYIDGILESWQCV